MITFCQELLLLYVGLVDKDAAAADGAFNENK